MHQPRSNGGRQRVALLRKHGCGGGSRRNDYACGRDPHTHVQPAERCEAVRRDVGLHGEDSAAGWSTGAVSRVYAAVDAFWALHHHPIHGVGKVARMQLQASSLQYFLEPQKSGQSSNPVAAK